jgi:hypothetical protein
MPELNPYDRFLDAGTSLARVAEILAATPGTLESLARAIGPERIDRAPAPGKWSPAQILCHLADCEIAFAFRLRQTLAEENHILQPFDQDRWAAPYAKIQAEQALLTFGVLRPWNLTLLWNAPSGAASKPVTHPERGTMTFSTILETMVGHDRNHLAQLEKLAATPA